MTVREFLINSRDITNYTDLMIRDYQTFKTGKWFGGWVEEYYERDIYAYTIYVKDKRIAIELAGEWNA